MKARSLAFAFAAALGLAASPALADIYKCQRDGTVIYSHLPCEPGAEPLDLPALGRLGNESDARRVRQRLQALRDLAVPAERTPAQAPAPRQGLSYGERLSLSKLEMKADTLRRELLNRRGSRDWAAATRRELASLQARINALRERM